MRFLHNRLGDKDATLAYLAGFFDGEGCVYILRGKGRTGSPEYNLEISFSNSDLAPLELARSIFGGKLSLSKDVRPGKKTSNRLRLRGNQAADALRLILPFLIVKKTRAEMAVQFQTIKSSRRGGQGRALSIERAEQFKAGISALNDKVWNANR